MIGVEFGQCTVAARVSLLPCLGSRFARDTCSLSQSTGWCLHSQTRHVAQALLHLQCACCQDLQFCQAYRAC